MAEATENREDKKLDWMYRDASQIVDREEYLLGRKIDKQFEKSVLPPEKDQECLPPSIFSKGTQESQVDIARKLQEDPLYLIKKKEIESREQLLKNPRKMKQLQEMIARQQAAAEKLKKKQMKKKKKKELDALLVKKCKQIFGESGTKKLAQLDASDSETSSGSESDSSKSKKKKKKKRKNLDKTLALKYKKILGNLDAEGLAKMNSTSESSSEDERNRNIRKKKESRRSSSSDERHKNELKKKSKKEGERRKKPCSSEDNSESDRKRSKTKHESTRKVNNKTRKERSRKSPRSERQREKRGRSSSSDRSDDKKKSRKAEVVASKDRSAERRYDSHHQFDYKEKNDSKYTKRGQQHRKGHGGNTSERKEKNEGRLKYCEKKEQGRSSRSSSESRSRRDKNKYSKNLSEVRNKVKREIKSDSSSESDTQGVKNRKSSKKDVSKRKKESSTSSCSENSSSESSSQERRKLPMKQYGLVLPANYVPKIKPKEESKLSKKEEEASKPYRKEIKTKLTEKEKESKLKEMMDNAKWRDDQRDKNIKAYKEKEKAEKDDYVYNEDFMRKQMAIAVSQGTVESRVKANINTIQRSGAAMSEHFARRK